MQEGPTGIETAVAPPQLQLCNITWKPFSLIGILIEPIKTQETQKALKLS